MANSPNVLVVFCDQMRGQAMGCMGNEDVISPTIDRFGDEGWLATRAYSPNPVCGPTRGSLLTGQYPHQHSVVTNNVRLPAEEQTIANVLQNAGYRTGYVGKWHLDGDEKPGYIPPGPRRRGFEYWEGFNRGHNYHRGHPRFTEDGECYWEEGYQPAVQTDLALEFLEEQAGGEDPFFLMVSWGPPHTPFNAPEEYSDMYDPEELTLRPNVPDELDTPDLRENLAEYYALITSLDDQFERLLDALDDQDAADDTIVVFLSDHGEMLGSHGRQRKGYPFEESINVPLAVRWPDEVASVRSDAVVSLLDLMPTLLSFCDCPIPDGVQGRDLSDLLQYQDGIDRPNGVYIEGQVTDDEAWRAVRTDRYLLAVDRALETRFLFDVEADPYQLKNLAGVAEYQDVEQRLHDQLVEASNEYGDQYVVGTVDGSDPSSEPLDPEGDVFDMTVWNE